MSVHLSVDYKQSPYVSSIVKNLWLVHFTYAWHIKNIMTSGLNASEDGLMGKGIYCCFCNDETFTDTLERIIYFMKDEINWHSVAEHLMVEGPDEIDDLIDLEQLIHRIFFRYSGSLLYGKENKGSVDIRGYVNLPVSNISCEQLVICDCLEKTDIYTGINRLNTIPLRLLCTEQ